MHRSSLNKWCPMGPRAVYSCYMSQLGLVRLRRLRFGKSFGLYLLKRCCYSVFTELSIHLLLSQKSSCGTGLGFDSYLHLQIPAINILYETSNVYLVFLFENEVNFCRVTYSKLYFL
ncbi:hypothetical protein BDC45DRAFT_534649 [Circinella umbellata]|nr:hypothetical protein BDC45DRAFT_534649 [Circinella umbellata]